MTSNQTACKKLEILAGYYSELQQITARLTLEDYQNQVLMRRAIEREIQLIVESATDINNMVLKKLNKGPAKDYFNSFLDLAENGVLDVDFALKIAPSTGLRNILVHEYQKIDDEIVYNSIHNVLLYYRQYIDQLAKYLGCN